CRYPSRAAPHCRERGRLSSLHGGFSVPGAVISGRGREGFPLPDPAGFRPPSSAPRPATEGRSPIVGTDGDPRPPGAAVTSRRSRRRTAGAGFTPVPAQSRWLRRRNVSRRRPQSSQAIATLAADFGESMTIVLGLFACLIELQSI